MVAKKCSLFAPQRVRRVTRCGLSAPLGAGLWRRTILPVNLRQEGPCHGIFSEQLLQTSFYHTSSGQFSFCSVSFYLIHSRQISSACLVPVNVILHGLSCQCAWRQDIPCRISLYFVPLGYSGVIR
ncbi:hypothetical protein HNQ38_001646 [Desulfovibrio intestinalis]|uniref:Uncharacterized protein n=1 Tax=Desulfovibrio intestinalis TaxID=58621 RepID=A0A7W8C3F2_9BACT|nr:hypothetical protein [Desulfovibrio intestinalis]